MLKLGDPAVIVFIGAVISVLGGLVGGYGVLRTTREQASEQIELRRKSEEIASLNREIASSQEELRKKSDEVAELNRNIADIVSGGDSFCYINMFPTSQKSLYLIIANDGQYPMYDVDIRIVDLKEFEKAFDDLKGHTEMYRGLDLLSEGEVNRHIRVGNIPPKTALSRTIEYEKPEGSKRVDFNVFISARNGSFVELFRIREVKGKWYYAFRVFKTGDRENILKEFIQPGFPKGVDGHVSWE